MAEDISASIIPLVQPRRPKTPAERAKAYRDRKKAAQLPVPVASRLIEQATKITVTDPAPVTPIVTLHAVTPSRRPVASYALIAVAFALAGVGIIINGWFSRSLGSTDTAGWLFLGLGVAADAAALALPSTAALLWRTHQRVTAAAGWAVWLLTFTFALMAGIGFASINIADVTISRASRVTPAIVTAQAALADAMAARDRECKGGVGKFCREREAEVAERRSALEAAGTKVEQTADPQTEAAIRIVSWLSHGIIKPTGDDFAMLRLVLLALLPQVGGILLMIARAAPSARSAPAATATPYASHQWS